MKSQNEILDKQYRHYNDYVFKSIVQKRANGILKFVKIPYRINRMLISEYTNLGPSISRMDFVGEAEKNGRTISLILECQTDPPTDDNIKRFFQYVSSLRIFKDNNVELYILCTKRLSYEKREFILNDDCKYTMHIISLKDFRAIDIFKSIEEKLENDYEITDDDIASLQLIIYTDFRETKLEILNRARELLEEISQRSVFDINEKLAIIYLFDMLSANMLDAGEHKKYMEMNSMLINPRDRYFKNKGIDEGMEKGKIETAKNLLRKGMGIDEIIEVTGLSKEDILNSK